MTDHTKLIGSLIMVTPVVALCAALFVTGSSPRGVFFVGMIGLIGLVVMAIRSETGKEQP